ncbi:hypothetical protein NQ038_05505 [Brevibacterium sp. 50QC2O2]|uniref:hypothetical protein n=1 Tax=Brevibacterium sp. 50QC2O2 TaxID=2968459 RepID=UPI00211BACE9|nr:hypothetical protein [Brevibacterium sp. 50QC2O2]MCQ9388102.1 hypothetical protein [Brevibacterium sp. 50QC2O2]
MDDEKAESPEESDMPEEAEGGEKDERNQESSSDTTSETLRKSLQNRRSKTSDVLQDELAPNDQEELRKFVEKIRPSIVNPLANYKIPKFALPQRPQIGISPEVIKRFTGALGVYDQIAKSAFSAAQTQSAWTKNLAIINSDAIRRFSATQLQAQSIIEQLAKNVDLGAISHYTKLAEQFRVQQASWFKNIIPNLDTLKAAFWPPNLRDIEGLDLDGVEAVVMLDGIGLYNVPRQSIATALIRADSAQKRRETLGRRWKAISSDCREALESCESEALATYVSTAIAALDALDAGHSRAAQALVGSLTDALLIDYLGDKRYLYTPNKKTPNSDAYKKFGIRKFIALAPMWQAYQQFWAKNGDTVPSTFNRNATAHTISGRQFNRRNTVQGLLFVCGLITFLEELLQRRQG